MNNNFKNVLLLVSVLVPSYFLASYIGGWYNQIDPQYGSLFFDSSDSVVVYGFIFSYIFFVPLIFELFSKKNKNKWIIILLAPIILFLLYTNTRLVYIFIITSIIGFLLAKIINFIVSKFKHPNLPMAVK